MKDVEGHDGQVFEKVIWIGGDGASFHELVSGIFKRGKGCFDNLVEMLYGISEKIEVV